MPRPPTPKDDLLDELQRLNDELERTPRKRDMNREGAYAARTYQNRFGSWSDAIERAGLDPHHSGKHSIPSDAELREELTRLATRLGDSPTKDEMNTRGKYSSTPYLNRFGTWSDALTEVGLEPNRQLRSNANRLSRSELLRELDRLADELEKTPSSVDMKREGKYSMTTYVRRFGSWADALAAVELDGEL